MIDRFPNVASDLAAERVHDSRVVGCCGATVLIVDDNPPIRESLAMLFRMAGFHVVDAQNGLEAVALAEEIHPDLIVTDLNMPELDGAGLIKRIRSAGPPISSTRIIAISVRGTDMFEGARVAGADALVDKLEDFDELLDMARRLLA